MGGWFSSLLDWSPSHTPQTSFLATAAPFATSTPAPTSAPFGTIAPTSAPFATAAPAPAEPGPVVVIPGNNGSVSCARYCNGDWGRGQLSARFPQYGGAYSTQFQASADGTCPCTMSNRVGWNQSQNPSVTAQGLGIM